MVNVKGVLGLKATPEGGVQVIPLVDMGREPLELTGLEWKQALDLLRQDAKLAALKAEAEDARSEVDGITWTP